jgi:CheY-like chemotaxis protein
VGQEHQKRRAVLIVEDDAELRSLTSALLEDEQLATIECESAEAALAVMLMGGQEVAMIFADIRLRGVMDGIDLAREVKVRWPQLSVVLTSGHPRDRVGRLPPGVGYMSKPWQPLDVLIAAEQALTEPIHALQQSGLSITSSARASTVGGVLPARVVLSG